MKRYTYPIFSKCDAPSAAEKTESGEYKLHLDLKAIGHHAYIDTHGFAHPRGKNPIFDEYEPLLDSSEELRFIEPGIADDSESKIGESRKLGRGIARYILSEYYGYTWFGKIQNLIKHPCDGWSAERLSDGGYTPDWLISNGTDDHCIGEAKGTHQEIKLDSKQTEAWREQCKNVIIKKDGRKKSLNSWLIATRYVKEGQSDKPVQLIEDPPTDGEPINGNDYPSLAKFIVRDHLSHTLSRIGNYELAIRTLGEQVVEGKTRVLIWQPTLKGLSHLMFIGRPVERLPVPWWQWETTYYSTLSEYWSYTMQYANLLGRDVFFDGIALDVVTGFLNRGDCKPLVTTEYLTSDYPFVSLLSDGNILLPLQLIKPVQFVEI